MNKYIIYDGIKFLKHHAGYYRNEKNINGHRARIYLHRYIWEKYNIKIPYGFHIHHKDGNPENNHIDNLTILDKPTHHKIHARPNNNFHRRIPVLQYDLDGNFIKRWDGQNVAAKAMNIFVTNINGCCRHKKHTKTAGGYRWSYAHE